MDRFFKTGFVLFSSLVPVLWFIEEFRPLLWNISWYAVTLLMLIRPVAQIAPKSWRLMRFLPWRKELGILSASIVVVATIYRFVDLGIGFFPALVDSLWSQTFPVAMGTLAELSAIPLLLTSNRHIQKRMKRWWKPVQRLSYLYFYGAGMLLVSYGKADVYWSMIIVASLATLSVLVRYSREVRSRAVIVQAE